MRERYGVRSVLVATDDYEVVAAARNASRVSRLPVYFSLDPAALCPRPLFRHARAPGRATCAKSQTKPLSLARSVPILRRGEGSFFLLHERERERERERGVCPRVPRGEEATPWSSRGKPRGQEEEKTTPGRVQRSTRKARAERDDIFAGRDRAAAPRRQEEEEGAPASLGRRPERGRARIGELRRQRDRPRRRRAARTFFSPPEP